MKRYKGNFLAALVQSGYRVEICQIPTHPTMAIEHAGWIRVSITNTGTSPLERITSTYEEQSTELAIRAAYEAVAKQLAPSAKAAL